MAGATKSKFNNESEPFALSVDDVYGDQWRGEFTFKIKLSGGDLLRQSQLRRQYLGDNAAAADTDELNMAVIYSQLAVRVVKAPAWWKEQAGHDIPYDVALSLFQQARKIEEDYILAHNAKAREAQEKLRADRAADAAKDEELES